jgi:hypothetical protein
MALNVFFRRRPLVTFRRKNNCQVVNQFLHTTWIRLEGLHKSYTLPNGIVLRDVAELAGYVDVNGQPAAAPFERYFYAKKYGLVAWKGDVGQSFMVEEFAPGTQPNNVREVISCL